jgi:hypothetical protein
MKTILIASLLLLAACGKYGFHEAPSCNRDFTVRSSGSNTGVSLTGAPYWYTVDGSGTLESFDLKAAGSTVCLYVE